MKAEGNSNKNGPQEHVFHRKYALGSKATCFFLKDKQVCLSSIPPSSLTVYLQLIWQSVYPLNSIVKLTVSMTPALSAPSVALCTLPTVWKSLCKPRRNSAPV